MIVSELKAWVATNLMMLFAAVSAALLVVVVIAFFWIRALHAEAETLKNNFATCKQTNEAFAAAAKTQSKAIDTLSLNAVERMLQAKRDGDVQRAIADGIREQKKNQPIPDLKAGADACVEARNLVEQYRVNRGVK